MWQTSMWCNARRFRQWIGKSILNKLVCSVLLVVLLPFIVWSSVYFAYLRNSNYNNQITSTERNLRQVSVNIEQQMENYVSYARFFAQDPEIKSLVQYTHTDIETINSMLYYIMPWFNLQISQNAPIRKIRILHNNGSLYDINHFLYRLSSDQWKERTARFIRIQKTEGVGIGYHENGYYYDFTASSRQDSDVWYIESAIYQNINTLAGIIEISVDNEKLCRSIREFDTSGGMILQFVTAGNQTAMVSPASAKAIPIDPGWDFERPDQAVTVAGRSYIMLVQELDFLQSRILCFVPADTLNLHMNQLMLLAIVAISVAGLSVLSYIISKTLMANLISFTDEIKKMQRPEQVHTICLNTKDEVGALAGSFNQMIDRLQKAFQTERKLIFDQLTNQIKPHFIGNALDMLRIRADLAGNHELAQSAEGINRYLIYSVMPASALISLQQEINNVINYIKLVNFIKASRFELGVLIDSEIEPELQTLYLPKLLLQPLFENSVRHGFPNRDAGFMHLHAARESSDLVITVEDNGIGMPEEQVSSLLEGIPSEEYKIGLANVYKRLLMHYGDTFKLEIRSKIHVGTEVVIAVPMDLLRLPASRMLP